MNHLLEWQNSCVDEQLIRLNVTALAGNSPAEYLLYSDALPRRNDGRVSAQILKRYEHTQAGGWWCSGVDLLTGEEDLWGCFKPDYPRFTLDQGKAIKYEHPPKAPTGVFALRVPLQLWQEIGQNYNIPILAEDIDQRQADLGFWQWLVKHPAIPLCITEGAKKAGALLSAGYAAIALPGIHNGYRAPRDEGGNRIGKSRLIPQLEKLATPGREIYIAFDQDRKATTIKSVNAAIKNMGYLLAKSGCSVRVITWDSELGKGVDDLIANHGSQAFVDAYQKSLPLDIWKAQSLQGLTYSTNLSINSRYLPELSIPETAKLIGIKSAKGTGKTKFLEKVVSQAIANHQWVLVIGHRVKLVEELCQRFGLNYITEVKENRAGQLLGYGLCIDSLHPHSQARFQAENWADGVVIIDEVEQVLWHGLNSSTCKGNRVAILQSLKTLMQNVLGGEGKIYVADADLSDISLDYLISLAGIPLQPFIIENDWKPIPKEACLVHHYSESTPKRLVKDLVKYIREGGKPFICLSAQKLTSQWGTQTLESYLKKQFPQAKVLRIDSESLAEPSHPAYGCITHLNQVLADYDIVLASPSIETGVSIDLKGHFTSVWAIAQGVQTVTSVCQSLGRIRENLPRYLWVATYGFNQVGNGSTSIPSLLTSGHRLTQLNIRLLQQADFQALDDLDTGFQAESLLCWAKMAVRVNASMINYRESILTALRAENHQIIDAISEASSTSQSIPNSPSQNPNQLAEAIKAVREQNYQAECEAIAQAEELTEEQYQTLKKRLVKTIVERRSLRKNDLKLRYGILVTPQLVSQDDRGWYQQLRLHYFLTVGRNYLADRDATIAKKLLKQGHGSLFLPDFNASQLGAVIGTMEVLGINVLLANPQRELCNKDLDLKAMATLAINNRSPIKTVVGLTIPQKATPMTIIRRFLELLGYGLTQIRWGNRHRIYQIVLPNDSREEIFKQWLIRDAQCPGSSELWFDENWISVTSRAESKAQELNNFIQLSLDFSQVMNKD